MGIFFNNTEKELSIEEMIENEVKSRQDQGDKYSQHDLMADVAPFFFFVNPPLAVIFTLSGLIMSAYNKKERLDQTYMPDSWLKDVSESDKISSEGLNFLAGKLKKNGVVNVSDAIKFLEIDEKVKKEAAELAKKNKLKEHANAEGALSILEKANAQSGGLYGSTIEAFKTSKGKIEEFGALTKDIGNKGINAAINIFKKDGN